MAFARFRNFLVVLSLLAGMLGCAGPGGGPDSPIFRPNDDVDLHLEHEQEYSLDEIRSVVVICYCPRRTIRQEPRHPVLVLRAAGRITSVGYQGPQGDPEPGLRAFLTFNARREGDVLILEANSNWRHIHHTASLSEIWVSLPSDRTIHIEPVPAIRAYSGELH